MLEGLAIRAISFDWRAHLNHVDIKDSMRMRTATGFAGIQHKRDQHPSHAFVLSYVLGSLLCSLAQSGFSFVSSWFFWFPGIP